LKSDVGKEGFESKGFVLFAPVMLYAIMLHAAIVLLTVPVTMAVPVDVAMAYSSHASVPSPLPGFFV
jgi:hypothetical protein